LSNTLPAENIRRQVLSFQAYQNHMRARTVLFFCLLAAISLKTTLSLSGQGRRGGAPPPPAIEGGLRTTDTTILINKPMATPAWALAERELIALNAQGVEMWADKYLDENGYLRGSANFGIEDGPDDAVESIRNWPLAHALGGDDSIIAHWNKAWEGHLDQYTNAKDPSTDLAKDGMYYKEFPTAYDWEHTGEGLGPFYWSGLSQPTDPTYQARLRRFAGFYMNEDPEARNYDPKLKLIPSLFNGSRGAKLTNNTQEDWNGRLLPGTKPSTRFLKATNILGDHPLNLASTNLAFHAYLVTHEAKYKNWLLEYVDAWKARIEANGGNIPSNVGRDGTIGGEWGGKWYGGVFGWNSPDEGVRNYVLRGPPEAFGNALLLTGNQAYTQVLRRQIDNLYAAKKVENGRVLLPRYYGDQGWYGFHDGESGSAGGLTNLREVETDVYMWDLQAGDLERLPKRGWIGYLAGNDPAYPLTAFQQGMEEIRRAAARLRSDTSTPDFPPHSTRGSGNNPVSTTALIELTLGGNDPNGSGHGPLPLHTQVRHFDPERRRAGLPLDVAALVERIRPEGVTLTLVNTSPWYFRTVTVQAGGYGEHQFTTVAIGDRTFPVDAPYFTIRLAPGAGESLTLGMQRYAHQPTLAFPWDRGWMVKQ
jgi:hypothetical protein